MCLILKGILKKAEAIEKSIYEQKAKFVYLCIREKRINSFKISVVINHLSYSKRILYLQKFLQKRSFFLYFRGRRKNGKRNKQKRRRKCSICSGVTKAASKKVANAEVGLNWLWTIAYGLFWLYIYIHEQFIAYLILIPMFWLVSWFLYCSTCSKSVRSMKPNGNISMEWAKVLSFVWEKVLFYREVKFLIDNLFGNFFQTSRVIGLTTLLYVKLRC